MRRTLLATALLWMFLAAPGVCLRAEDGATALAHNYQTVFENDQMLVVHVHYDAGETLPVHAHSHYPTVYVYLSKSGPVRFRHEEAGNFALTRRPVKAGWFRVSPGRIERHEVANLGPVASDFLRVELKQIPLGRIPEEFRFTRDIDITRSGVTTDYRSPEMDIRRYVVVDHDTAHINADAQGRLLIAFSATSVAISGKPASTLAAGSVLWLPPGTSADLRQPGATAPAHLLTIRLLR